MRISTMFGNANAGVPTDGSGNATVTGNMTVSGNLGVGTTSPAQKIHLEDSGSQLPFIQFSGTGNASASKIGKGASLFGGANAFDLGIASAAGQKVFLGCGSAFSMVGSSGMIGIGLTSPTSMLHVVSPVQGTIAQFGDINIGNGLQIISGNGGSSLDWILNAINSRSLVFQTNQTEGGRFDANSNFITKKAVAMAGYDTSTATSGTITASANKPGLMITSAGGTTLTIKLPSSPIDGQEYWVASEANFTTVTWQDAGGTAANVIGGQASLGGTSRGQRFVYVLANTKWYAI